MNRTTQCMLWLAGFALVTASCSQSGPATGGNGGATSSGGGTSSGGTSATGSGGSTSTGGATTSAGGTTTNAGGTATSAGGTATSAGGTATNEGGTATNAGGLASAGGVARTGGSITGAGGTTTGSGGSNSAGGTNAAGGVARTGGSSTSNGGTTTSAGGTSAAGGTTSGSGGGTGTTVPPSTIVPSLDGFLWVMPASAKGTASGANYPDYDVNGNCPNATAAFATQGIFSSVVHKVGGTTGTQYTINFELRGVLGTECYSGGSTTATGSTQPTLAANPEVANNGWYMGGSPVASKWNTYEVHVKPAVGTTHLNPADNTENVYYLNAFPTNPSGWCSKEGSFPMNYKASFPVMGGGTITLTMHDSNCLTQQNCGPIGIVGVCANNPRSVDISDMTQPATSTVLASMTQPYKQIVGSSTWLLQWALFAVRSVTSP